MGIERKAPEEQSQVRAFIIKLSETNYTERKNIIKIIAIHSGSKGPSENAYTNEFNKLNYFRLYIIKPSEKVNHIPMGLAWKRILLTIPSDSTCELPHRTIRLFKKSLGIIDIEFKHLFTSFECVVNELSTNVVAEDRVKTR